MGAICTLGGGLIFVGAWQTDRQEAARRVNRVLAPVDPVNPVGVSLFVFDVCPPFDERFVGRQNLSLIGPDGQFIAARIGELKSTTAGKRHDVPNHLATVGHDCA